MKLQSEDWRDSRELGGERWSDSSYRSPFLGGGPLSGPTTPSKISGSAQSCSRPEGSLCSPQLSYLGATGNTLRLEKTEFNPQQVG